MRLLFTERTTRRLITMGHLPLLPIVLDYRDEMWYCNKQITLALENPSRVCSIALTLPNDRWYSIPMGQLALMNQYFPALESLEFKCLGDVERTLRHSPPFLTVEPPQLRRLKFTGNISAFLHQILSRTTCLVELTLCLDIDRFSSFRTQLTAKLQGLSFLRRLNLEIWDILEEQPDSTKDFLLPQLTYLSFTGHITQLEALMACLAAPSLQELRITLPEPRPIFPNATYLSEFIHNLGKTFLSAQLNASHEGASLVLSSHPVSTDDPPFRIVASPIVSIQQTGSIFSAVLATVQDVFIASPFSPSAVPHTRGLSPWRTFFMLFHNAKVLRLSRCIESDVGAILQPDNRAPASRLLPVLEEIELNAGTPNRIDKNELASFLDLFKRFVDARYRTHHPVNVRWNTDRVLPEHFCDAEVIIR
jgi:hypothetical protein